MHARTQRRVLTQLFRMLPSCGCVDAVAVVDDAASSPCLLSLTTATWLVSVACIVVSLLGWTKTRVLIRISTLMVTYTFMRFSQKVSDAWARATGTHRKPRAWVYPYPLPTAPVAPSAARPVMKRPRPLEAVTAPLVTDKKNE